MRSVGIDLHKNSITVRVVDQDRTVLQTRRFACADITRIDAFFASLGEFEAVVEATASYEWLWQRVEPRARRVVLAPPGKLRILAGSTRKSDKLDARVLAEFRALDLIPPADRPTPGSASTGRWSGTASSSRRSGPSSATRSAASPAAITPTAATCSAAGGWKRCRRRP